MGCLPCSDSECNHFSRVSSIKRVSAPSNGDHSAVYRGQQRLAEPSLWQLLSDVEWRTRVKGYAKLETGSSTRCCLDPNGKPVSVALTAIRKWQGLLEYCLPCPHQLLRDEPGLNVTLLSSPSSSKSMSPPFMVSSTTYNHYIVLSWAGQHCPVNSLLESLNLSYFSEILKLGPRNSFFFFEVYVLFCL